MKKLLFIILFACSFFIARTQSVNPASKKVLMHYMLWYGDSPTTGDDSLRHWKLGHTYHPVIGQYNSQSWALQTYHVLLTYSCGIDGLIANVKDTYDSISFGLLFNTINRIAEYDTSFHYFLAISYDDQGIDTLSTAKSEFETLRDQILPNTQNYLKYNDTAVVFIFNYADTFLTAKDYRMAVNEVFADSIYICWNESQDSAIRYIDASYSWVQAFDQNWDHQNGTEWGKKYIEDFFWRIDNIPALVNETLRFGCAGVWPGFNDTSIIEPNWNRGRWMDRRDGITYDSTWLMVHNYEKSLPLPWVIIETFNDWNEGSQIEPDTLYGYRFLDSTIVNINTFKDVSILLDGNRYKAARQLYKAGLLIEQDQRDSIDCYPCYKNAIIKFLADSFLASMICSDTITNGWCTPTDVVNEAYDRHPSLVVYPNPSDEQLHIILTSRKLHETGIIQLINPEGKIMQCLQVTVDRLKQDFDISMKSYPPGIYYVICTMGDATVTKKVVIK